MIMYIFLMLLYVALKNLVFDIMFHSEQYVAKCCFWCTVIHGMLREVFPQIGTNISGRPSVPVLNIAACRQQLCLVAVLLKSTLKVAAASFSGMLVHLNQISLLNVPAFSSVCRQLVSHSQAKHIGTHSVVFRCKLHSFASVGVPQQVYGVNLLFVLSCLSVRMEHNDSHRTDFVGFMFCCFLLKFVDTFSCWLISDESSGHIA